VRLGWSPALIVALCFGGYVVTDGAGQGSQRLPRPEGAATPSPADVAAALQRKYDRINDFTADFVQVYRAGALKRQTSTERGSVMIKKPGRMRWTYTAPERKEFVSDGFKYYAYIPADRQVIVSDVPSAEEPATPAFFLAGKGNLLRDFTAATAEVPREMPAGTLALKLTPKTAQPDYDWLILALDPATLALRGLVTSDRQGGTSTIAFTNLKENVGLADKSFEFKPPRGVDVITNSGPR
jgi:outer membrane lipoprotein carrier protein